MQTEKCASDARITTPPSPHCRSNSRKQATPAPAADPHPRLRRASGLFPVKLFSHFARA